MDTDSVDTSRRTDNGQGDSTRDSNEVFELFEKLRNPSELLALNLFPPEKDKYGRFIRTSRFDYSQMGESSSRSPCCTGNESARFKHL